MKENITRGRDGEREYIPANDPTEQHIDQKDEQVRQFILMSRSLQKVLFNNHSEEMADFWVSNFGLLGLDNINRWNDELNSLA